MMMPMEYETADSEVQEQSKLSVYEFNIRMFTLLCNAYSDIKAANICSAKNQLLNVVKELDEYYK